MSFLPALRLGARRAVYSAYAGPATTSAFHSSAVRPTLKETDKNRDDLPEYYEAKKEEQVKSSKEGKSQWNQELASNSEADVKADRGEMDTGDQSFEQMQERTKHAPHQKNSGKQ